MDILDRTAAPAYRAIEKLELREADTAVLDNGIPVYSVDAGQQEVVKVEIVFRNSYTSAGQVLTSGTVNRLLAEGTAKHTALQLSEQLDYYGAFYETDEGLDFNSVSLFSLCRHLDKVLPVLLEILTAPTFPEKELDLFRQNSRQRLLVNQEKVSYLARTRFPEMLFGSQHPYGYRAEIAHIEKLERDELMRYYSLHYALSGCSVFVSGKLDDSVFRMLNATFGAVKSSVGQGESVFPFDIDPFVEKKQFVRKEKAIQSALRFGKLMFNKTHRDYHGMVVLSTVLGGYFGSRLMSNLREDKGYTYGIGSSMHSLLHGGYFVIGTEVAREVSEDAQKQILAEIERLLQEPVGQEELQQVKNYLMGGMMRSLDGPFNLADRAKSLVLYGLDYSYYSRYFDTIRNISASDLQELACKYLVPDTIYQLEAGDK